MSRKVKSSAINIDYFEDILDELFITHSIEKSFFTRRCSLITHHDYDIDAEVQTLMPNFRNSLYPYTSDSENATHEFFIYSPSMNEEHIIRTFTNANEGSIRIDLHRANGEYLNSKVHYPNGEKGYFYVTTNVTKNGKYLYYLISPKDDNANDLGGLNPDSDEEVEEGINLRKVIGGRTKDANNPLFESQMKQSLMIYEINFVRRKSMKKKLTGIKKRLKKSKPKAATSAKIQKKVSESEMMIELKLVREFKNCGAFFGDNNLPEVSDLLTISFTKKERVLVNPDMVEKKDIDDGLVEVLEYDYPYDYEFPYPLGAKQGDMFKKKNR